MNSNKKKSLLKFVFKTTNEDREVWGQKLKKSSQQGDFEILGTHPPQLHQNLKPIRHLFCTFSSCSDLGIYLSYNIYNFQENKGPQTDHSLTSLTFTSLHFTSLSLSLTINLGESYLVPRHRRPAGQEVDSVRSRVATGQMASTQYIFRLAHKWLGHSTCKTSPWMAWAQYVQEQPFFFAWKSF